MSIPDKGLVFVGIALAVSPLLIATAAQANGGAQTALNEAARKGDIALLRSKLAAGADPNVRDESGRTPLMDAVEAGQLGAARMLLVKGADVNAQSDSGRTALIEAATKGRLDVAQVLVLAGADLNHEQRGWGTALECAERNGRADIAKMLRRAGARSSGHSVGDGVCVRAWRGDGYCGTVEAVERNEYRIRVTKIVGCRDGCEPKGECSAGRPVGVPGGIDVGDEVTTVSWCLTHTGVTP